VSSLVDGFVEMFPLILLAGGKSSRMGSAKGLLCYQGRFWLLEQLRQFAEAGGRRVVIVLGFQSLQYIEAIPWLGKAVKKTVSYRGLDVLVCINPVPEKGPFSSLQFGARRLFSSDFPGGVFVLPIDVPAPERMVWKALAAALAPSTVVCLPRCQDRGGHPVLLSATFLDQILAESPDSADARLDRRIGKLDPESVERVEVDDVRISMNLNTPERWQTFVDCQDRRREMEQ